MRLVVLLALASCSHGTADPKGSTVNSYSRRSAVTSVKLVEQAAVGDVTLGLLAAAPDNATWARVGPGVTFYSGERELRSIAQQPHNAAGGIGFSSDGKTLHVGMHDVDVATATLRERPVVPDLAAWASAAKLPAPPTLAMVAARTSDDGSVTVVAASGMTRDRTKGARKPETGDVDWLIALDGATRAPRAVLWHGRGENSAIAISERHVAAGGNSPLRVFARGGWGDVKLGGALRTVHTVTWSPDGELLGAIGEGKTVAIWRAGAWGAPAAQWQVGGGYQQAIAFHPVRPLVAVGNDDGHLRVYGVGDGQLVAPVLVLDVELGGRVGALAFSPDGATLRALVQHPQNRVIRFAVAIAP